MIFTGLASQVPSVSELGEEIGKLGIAARWRAPSHVNDLRALARKVVGKKFKTDVDDSRRRRQQGRRLHLAFIFVHFMHPFFYLAEPSPILPVQSADIYFRNDHPAIPASNW